MFLTHPVIPIRITGCFFYSFHVAGIARKDYKMLTLNIQRYFVHKCFQCESDSPKWEVVVVLDSQDSFRLILCNECLGNMGVDTEKLGNATNATEDLLDEDLLDEIPF